VAALPQPTHGTVQLIYQLHERRAAEELPRGYLGWSQIGETCDRALWYSLRWAERERFDGRMARLFNTGHLEEARVLQELRDAGVEVWDRDPATGEQFEVVSVNGHLRGHLDAIARGLPEAPKTAHLVDVKTIKAKKFDELVKRGIRTTYPKYWAQGHGYMGRVQLTRAMFIFVCKDDDRIHIERFEFDKGEFERYEQRAARLVAAAEPPSRFSDDPQCFECKYCAYNALCHATAAPQVNCRTCAHSTPVEGGAWSCARYAIDAIPLENQLAGCADHRYIPILLERFAKPVDADASRNTVTYELAGGGHFVNGEPPEAFASAEIRACADKRFLGAGATDPYVQQLRREFGAEIVA
jgi:hypothetical protein